MILQYKSQSCKESTQIKTKTWRSNSSGAYEGGRAPPAPLYACPPPERLKGAPMGEALLILHLLAFPLLRPGTVAYLGGGSSPLAPPGSSRRGTAP